MRKIFIIMAIGAISITATSCRAWRTVTTTSTYSTQSGDKSESVTIQTKTVEDYQGKKKWLILDSVEQFIKCLNLKPSTPIGG